MAGLKRVFLKICNRIFFRQRVDVEVYSEKTQSWMTVSIPKGRADLVQQELSKLEDKIERPEIPIIPKEPKLLDIGQRNQWIKNIYVSVSVPSILYPCHRFLRPLQDTTD
jgi:hypothetical protein